MNTNNQIQISSWRDPAKKCDWHVFMGGMALHPWFAGISSGWFEAQEHGTVTSWCWSELSRFGS